MQFLIFGILVIYLIIDFKRCILLYAPLKLFFIKGFELFGIWDLDIVFCIFAFIVFLIKKGEKVFVPWISGIVICVLAYVFYTAYPSLHPTLMVTESFSIYIYGYLYFQCICSKEHLHFAIFCLLLTLALLGINGILEEVTQYNLLGEIQEIFIRDNVYICSVTDQFRFGIRRVRSFIPHPIGFGVVSACGLYLIVLLKEKFHYLSKQCFGFLFSVLIIGVIISGSRSPLLGIILMFIPIVFSTQNLRFSYFLKYGLVFFVGYIIIGDYILSMLDSLVSSNNSEFSGSSFEMREIQFDYSLALMMKNPLFGLGPDVDIFSFGERNETYGLESIWYALMIQRGFIGICAYVYMYISIIWGVGKSCFSKEILFFLMGWLVIDTATNLPGINFFFPLMIVTIIYKAGIYYVESAGGE